MKKDEVGSFIETLVPYIIKKVKQDNYFKNVAKITQGNVISINEEEKIAMVQLPYDVNTFSAKINTTDTIAVGDNVFLLYWGDLKNAFIVFKN